MSSVNDKLERVRKPRVHIKYEVETEGGVEQKELPFVVGVMGDFAGHSTDTKPIKDRKFVKIDRDNFNEVMARTAPQLNLRVSNEIADDGSDMNVNLKFDSIEDFEPTQIANQVPALRKLLETRNKLTDLLTKSDRSYELETILEKALQDPEAMQALAKELGIDDEKTGE